MEQITMEQLAEVLKSQIAGQARMEAKLNADKEEMMARMDADKAEMMAWMEAKMDSNQEKMDTVINCLWSSLEGAIKTGEEMKACREVTRLSGEEGTNSRRGRVHGGARGSP
jgi:hypothetical protein